MAVIKMLEMVGTSNESWQDATVDVVAEAAKTIHGIEFLEVLEQSIAVGPNGELEWQVHVRLGFRKETG